MKYIKKINKYTIIFSSKPFHRNSDISWKLHAKELVSVSNNRRLICISLCSLRRKKKKKKKKKTGKGIYT